MKVQEIISDEELDNVHADNFFGSMEKRDVLKSGVLAVACGHYYVQGNPIRKVIAEHSLIDVDCKLTDKGRSYLWAAFGDRPEAPKGHGGGEDVLPCCPYCGGEPVDSARKFPGKHNIWCSNQPVKCGNRSVYTREQWIMRVT